MLSDEERLQSERGEGKNWTSKIPQIHAFGALYASLNSTSLVSDCRPKVAEELRRDASKHQGFQQELRTEERPKFLPHTFDRLSSPMPVKTASIDIWENNPGAVLHSQKSSSHPPPDAKVSPQVLLGYSSQAKALFPDLDLFPQVSLAVHAITGKSSPLATNTAPSDGKLGDYFRQTQSPTQFTDRQCQDITRLLRENGKDSWSRAPRIYIILRLIGQLQVLDAFLDQGVNDLWLPLIQSSLPHALSVAYHQEFMTAQPLALTKALDLEKNTGGHAHFTRDDPFPFETKETLGRGASGIVDRIISPLSDREFARKRFRRRKGLCKTELESFMNELKILKRLHHIHCVELVSISPIQSAKR